MTDIILPHLYLIKFNDGKHFKFGMSLVGNYNRVSYLSKIYDSGSVVIFNSENDRFIRLIEYNIKVIFGDFITEDNDYYGKDGYTEIRDIKYYDEILELIYTFQDRLGLEKCDLDLDAYINNDKKEKKVIVEEEIVFIESVVDDGVIDDIKITLDKLESFITYIVDMGSYNQISFNLSTICNDDDELDLILEPFLRNIMTECEKHSLCGGYTYSENYDEVIINLEKDIEKEYLNEKIVFL